MPEEIKEGALPEGQELPPAVQHKVEGTEEEVAEFRQGIEQDLLAAVTPPTPPETKAEVTPKTEATPQATPATPEKQTLDVDGQKVSVDDLINAYKLRTNVEAMRAAATQRNMEVAEQRRQQQAQQQATIDALQKIIDERIPKKPPEPPPPPKIDMSSLPPMPDISTFEGMEQFQKEWLPTRDRLLAEQVASGTRETVLKETASVVESRVGKVEAGLAADRERESLAAAENYNVGLKRTFLEEAKAAGLTEEQVNQVCNFVAGNSTQGLVANVVPHGPVIGGSQLYSLDDLRIGLNALGFRKAEQRGREEGVRNVTDQIKAAQAASDVARPSASPAPQATKGSGLTPLLLLQDPYQFHEQLEARTDLTEGQKQDILYRAQDALGNANLLR